MKRKPRPSRRERRAELAASREGWRDYGQRQDEPWLAVLGKLPAEWVDRTGGGLLVPPWLCAVIDAWHEETFGSVDPAALITAVQRHGTAAAGMLLAKLAGAYDTNPDRLVG